MAGRWHWLRRGRRRQGGMALRSSGPGRQDPKAVGASFQERRRLEALQRQQGARRDATRHARELSAAGQADADRRVIHHTTLFDVVQALSRSQSTRKWQIIACLSCDAERHLGDRHPTASPAPVTASSLLVPRMTWTWLPPQTYRAKKLLRAPRSILLANSCIQNG